MKKIAAPPAVEKESRTSRSATEVLTGTSKKSGLARLMPFLGPAFIASVAYMDPGNFATNIQGGAKFGYQLLWVIVASNLMAMLIQSLSAKLGIATGQNLAEHCRNEFPRPVVISMWIIGELVAIATDSPNSWVPGFLSAFRNAALDRGSHHCSNHFPDPGIGTVWFSTAGGSHHIPGWGCRF
jgi:hypothetical protein